MSGRDQVVARALRAGWAVGSRVPDAFATRLLDVAADQTWRARGAGVRQLERNLARAAPEVHGDRLHDLGRAAMRSYFRYWGETFQLPRWSEQEIRDRVVVHDGHRLHDAYAAGHGVVGALPHSGNWDLAGAWACSLGMPLTTVAERLRPEKLYADFVAYRVSLGMEILPLSGAGPSLRLLVERLRAGRFVPLLADRDLSRGGVVVPLLGEDASVPSGPARLAQLAGATLLPITCDYTGPQGAAGQMHLRMHEPVPHVSGRAGAVAMTSAVADAFSAAIMAAPTDWHMLQPVFVADPAVPGRS
ncbi:MAG: phosphatidylinositol mannoside acyltransferase [Nocardioidaceae bacterium]|nr:phosphatidylinositol mannoside acyltransferase [Nocardioidaceae bacterium]